MAAVAGLTIPSAKIFARVVSSSDAAKPPQAISLSSTPWRRGGMTIANGRMPHVRNLRPLSAAPDKLSENLEESIKAAQEVCSEDPVSGECAASWDEVEELSAAIGHLRDKQKESDPLENYCKDNPEVDECRTYDN